MKIKKVIFSYDRPIQLQGLCRSILQNSDLQPSNLWCICRSSSAAYQSAYDSVGQELGVHIIQENRVVPGLDLRQLYQLTAWLPRGRRAISRQLHRLTTSTSLPDKVLALTDDVDYVSLAVDDMVYFRDSSFALATNVLADNSEICLWSWRIGYDRYPHPDVLVQNGYWVVPHRQSQIPYNYIFHTDGSVFRRADLEQWLLALPTNTTLNLNMIEGILWQLYQDQPERFSFGPLHAGPLKQTCTTWQVNRVSPTATAGFHAESYSDPAYLLRRYSEGARLDFSDLTESDEWLTHLNRDWPDKWTHVAPTLESVDKWFSMMRNQ